MRRVAIRADASVAIGSGHLKRSLALARALRGCGAQVHFVCAGLDGTAARLMAGEPFSVSWIDGGTAAQDAEQTWAAIAGLECAWIVVDHYGLDAAWHEALRMRAPWKLAAVDDLHDRPLSVDLLLDGNDPDARVNYRPVLRRPAKVLAGPMFALLDPAYAHAPAYVPRGDVRSVGIFMGTTDPSGACVEALGACVDAGFAGDIEVVCSTAAPRFAELARVCEQRPRTTLVRSLARLDEFFVRHDLQIGAGGSASWERCCLGTPSILCLVAANQLSILPRLEAAGAAFWAKPQDGSLRAGIAAALKSVLRDPACLATMSSNARALVDGRGSLRAAAILMLLAGAPFAARHATPDDEELLLHWANEPEVRRQAFSTAPIDAQTHGRWFQARLRNPDCTIHVVEAPGGLAAGYVKLERQEGAWEIGYSLDASFRGLGIAANLLQTVLREHGTPRPLRARVKPGNTPSLAVFRRLGFREETVRDDRGPHVLFTLEGQ